MAGGTEDPFEGVSATELRRMLVEAGDRRLDALSVEAAQEARREQAVLVTELQRRGERLEEPVAPPSASSNTSDWPKPSAAVQEQLAASSERVVAARPALRPPRMRADRPEKRDTTAAASRPPDPGFRFERAADDRHEPATSAGAAEVLVGMAADLNPPRPGGGSPRA